MKKLLLTLFLSAFFLGMSATQRQIHVESSDTIIIPRTDPITPNPSQGDGHRTTQTDLQVFQNGYILNFTPVYSGGSLELLDMNWNTVFSGIVDSDGYVLLPKYLEGVYVIRFIFSDIVFQGEIEL